MLTKYLNITNNKILKIVFITIVTVFLFDFITKIFHEFEIEGFRRYSAIPKLLIEISLVFYLFKNGIKDKKNIFFGSFLILISAISFVVFDNDISIETVSRKIYDLNRYLFLFLFAIVLLNMKKNTRKEIIRYSRNILIVVGIVNAFFIILGLFTHYEILRSYAHSSRFGYNGLLLKTSEASYLYILLIITTYYEYIYHKTKGFWCLFFVLISLLIGTKAVWLFLVLLGLIHFTFHKQRYIRMLSIGSLMIGAFLVVVFSERIVLLIVNAFSFGPKLYEKSGFIAVITSTRSLLLKNTTSYINENWTLANHIFGGINLRDYGVEFEFIDIYLFFGFIGFMVYLLLLKKVFFNNHTDKYKLLLFIALMLVAAFAGNLLVSVLASSFAFVVFQYMQFIHEDIEYSKNS